LEELDDLFNDKVFDLDKIETDEQLKYALEIVERLFIADTQLTTLGEQRLSDLVDLIVEYEKIKFPMGEPTKEDAERFRKDQEGD